jgi:tripartite-type tricarboxylate transporter receptor subunit TctC
MRKGWLMRSFRISALALAGVLSGQVACMAADFYAGKTVTITVGFTPGGMYDQMARLYSRPLGRFLPGNPTIVVQNQPGAGSLVTANNLAKLWAGDATRLGVIGGGTVWAALLGDKQANFDPRDFAWIGGKSRDTVLCALWHLSPTSSLEDARRRETVVGATGPGSRTLTIPKALNELAGTRFKIVSGYPGGTEIEMAMEKGEVEGYCGWALGAVKRSKPAWYAEGKLKYLIQFADAPSPDLAGAPLATQVVSDDTSRQVMEFISSDAVLSWPLVAPPGLDPQRVSELRQAFDAMMRDPVVLAEGEQGVFDLAPVSGLDLQALVDKLSKTPADVLAIVRRINEGK